MAFRINRVQRHEVARLLRGDEEITISDLRHVSRDAALLDRLVELDQACFPIGYTEADSRSSLLYCNRIYTATSGRSGEIVGMLGQVVTAPEVYIVTVEVAESARNKGIYQDLLHSSMSDAISEGMVRLALETQNAKVEYGMVKVLDRLVGDDRIEGYSIERQIRYDYFWGGRPAGSADLKSKSGEINRRYEQLGSADAFRLTAYMFR